MFYDIYRQLCEQAGVTPSKAALDMGINKATVTYWKKSGSSPSPEVLQKVAQYFNTSADALLELPSQPVVTDNDLKFALFGRGDVDDDLFDEVKAFAQFAAEQRQKPKKKRK